MKHLDLVIAATLALVAGCKDKADPALLGKAVAPPGIGSLDIGDNLVAAKAALPGAVEEKGYSHTLSKQLGDHLTLVVSFSDKEGGDSTIRAFRLEMPHETCVDTLTEAWGKPMMAPINSVPKKYPQWRSDDSGWRAYADDLGKHLGCTIHFGRLAERVSKTD